ncbi:unnamed protein product [marine sediment metagenome]|uniref:Uncharacterized protein n=1 Tax=marine sediment metagenome TaxID=412755 RepID=X1IQH1_9ZZZZ
MKRIKQFLQGNNNLLNTLKKYLNVLFEFNEKFFIIFLIIYLSLLLVEQLLLENLKEYIDLNNILIFLIIGGIIYSLSIRKEKVVKKEYELRGKDIVLIAALGIIGSYLIWLRIKEWKIISYFISISLGIFIICFLYLFLKNE